MSCPLIAHLPAYRINSLDESYSVLAKALLHLPQLRTLNLGYALASRAA
jgi:hypothetical protein